VVRNAAADGEYTIRVYLMRSAARRNEIANYTLTVGITGSAAPRPCLGAHRRHAKSRYAVHATGQCRLDGKRPSKARRSVTSA